MFIRHHTVKCYVLMGFGVLNKDLFCSVLFKNQDSTIRSNVIIHTGFKRKIIMKMLLLFNIAWEFNIIYGIDMHACHINESVSYECILESTGQYLGGGSGVGRGGHINIFT